MPKIVAPRILVLEGLYADTAEIIDDCGGIGIEASPWNPKDVAQKLESGLIDGLLLTGGTDVNPAHYGQQPCPVTQSPDYQRDATELWALNYCREHKLPVLGICRGSQIMCVSQGGRLTQDIQLYTDAYMAHGGSSHDVFPTDVSRTFRKACLMDVEDGPINATSLHHQCVADPGRGMRIAATARDGTPEAIESKDGLMLGVQFHPEMSAYNDERAFGIFRWLVQTAARRKGGKAEAVSFREACDDYLSRRSRSWEAYCADAAQEAFDGGYGDSYNGSTSAAFGYTLGWDDESYEAGTQSTSAASPGLPPRSSRQAGDPAIPSMRDSTPSQREMVRLIEESTGSGVTVFDAGGKIINGTCEDEPYDCDVAKGNLSGAQPSRPTDRQLEIGLRTCPTCHILFDLIEDCDDHKRFVHPTNVGAQQEQRLLEMVAGRYPELEPPPGHEAWDDDETVARIVDDLRKQDLVTDWEDVDS